MTSKKRFLSFFTPQRLFRFKRIGKRWDLKGFGPHPTDDLVHGDGVIREVIANRSRDIMLTSVRNPCIVSYLQHPKAEQITEPEPGVFHVENDVLPGQTMVYDFTVDQTGPLEGSSVSADRLRFDPTNPHVKVGDS